MRPGRTLLLLLVSTFEVACGAGERPARTELVVSAASSLRGALQEIDSLYQRAHPEVVVRLNAAASGTLEQQIRSGARVDVFIAAAEAPMDALQRAGLIEADSRVDVAGNELVLAVPAAGGAPVASFRDLARPEVKRVALGEPASVPAGAYAVETLHALGVWEAVRPKAIYAQNVRQVLAYLERGEVDAGLVYRSDALGSARVRVVETAPAGTHRPIRYPAAVVAASAHHEAARAYLDFLAGAEARGALARFGFTLPD